MSQVEQYFIAIAVNKSSPVAEEVILAAIWYGKTTRHHLFGVSSSQRSSGRI